MKLARLLPMVLVASLAFGTATVSGKLQNPDTTGAVPGYVQFDLQNCGGNAPTVSGATISPQQKFQLNSDGTWSGTLSRNDEIFCNGINSTWWHKTYFVNFRKVGPAMDYVCSQSSCAFDGTGGLTPLTVYPSPTAPAQPLTGPVSFACSFPVAASTWTCNHNFGTTALTYSYFDASGNALVKGVGSGPTSVVETSTNTLTATFASPTAGSVYVVNVGNWTPSALFPNYIIANPSAPQTITGQGLTLTSSAPLTSAGTNGFSGSNTSTGPWTFSGLTTFNNVVSFLTGAESQANIFMPSANPINFQTNYQATNGGAGVWSSDVLAVGVNVPNTSTTTQVDGVGVYLSDSSNGQGSGGANVVGVYAAVRCLHTNCHGWGMNPLVQMESGFTPEYMNTLEADFNNNSGVDATDGQATVEDGIDVISGGTKHPLYAMNCKATSAPGYWQRCFFAQSYQKFGMAFQNGAVGSQAIYIVPPDNTTSLEIEGRNTANNADLWSIQNSGNAAFPLVTSLFQTTSANAAQSGVLRCSSADSCLAFRNNANNGDLPLAHDSSDRLIYNTQVVSDGAHPNIYLGGTGAASMQSKRGTAGCATGASVGATCTTTVTWTSAFADANYTAVCTGSGISSGVPVGGGLTAHIAASVTFQTVAATAAAAQYTAIECTAIHD